MHPKRRIAPRFPVWHFHASWDSPSLNLRSPAPQTAFRVAIRRSRSPARRKGKQADRRSRQLELAHFQNHKITRFPDFGRPRRPQKLCPKSLPKNLGSFSPIKGRYVLVPRCFKCYSSIFEFTKPGEQKCSCYSR